MAVDRAATYEILAEGVMTDAVTTAAAERDLDVSRRGALLVLRGRFRDLAELNEVLFGLDDLGLALVEARQVA